MCSLWVHLPHKHSITTSHFMMNSMQVTLPFPAMYSDQHDVQRVSDNLFLQCILVNMRNSKWVTSLLFPARHSHPILFRDELLECRLQCPFFLLGSLIISYHDQQDVGDTTLFSARQSHHTLVCEWHRPIFCSLHHILWPTDCEQQHTLFCPSSLMTLITPHSMTNRLWATVHLFSTQQSYHISCHKTGCEWQYPSSLIASHPRPTGCEWHCPFVCQAASSHLMP